MGCGDSKERKTVTAKTVGGGSALLIVHPPVQIQMKEDPDDEAEVMARAKKTKTIEEAVPEQPTFPEVSEKREDHLEATQVTEMGEGQKAAALNVKFRSGGGSAVEDLEMLEASLNEHSPLPKTKKKPEREAMDEGTTHADELLEDLLGEEQLKKLL